MRAAGDGRFAVHKGCVWVLACTCCERLVFVHVPELYGNFRVFLSILKVDLFFVILLLMLGSFFLFKGTRESTVVVDAVALGASLLWSFVGWYSVRARSGGACLTFARGCVR